MRSRWTPAQRELFDSLADELIRLHGHGRAIVAIDGVDGAGKTTFADNLAEAIQKKGHPVFRASVDGFHRPKAERYRLGKDSPEGFYRESFDYSAMRRMLVEPFELGGSAAFVTAAFDHRRDAPVEPKWLTAPDDAILLLDGIFLQRPELRDLWEHTIWLEVPVAIAAKRMLTRDGPGSNVQRYTGGQELYVAEAGPRAAARTVIDNSDVDQPFRVAPD
jgi:uridine kinase